MQYKYNFEIEIRDNKSGNQWVTTDVTVAENEKQALVNIDEENDRLGYKVMRAILTSAEPFETETCPDCGSHNIEVIDGPIMQCEANRSGECQDCFCAWTID